MKNLRKRNINTTTKEIPNDEKPSIVKKVRFAIEEAIFKKSSKKGPIERIEQGSLLIYLILFVVVLVFSSYLVAYLHELENVYTVPHTEKFIHAVFDVECSNDYGDQFKQCAPKHCARVIKDGLFSKEDIKNLKNIAIKGMKYGGGNGGATILDLHSGALSYKDKFMNLYKIAPQAFTKEDFQLYSKVKNRILRTIAEQFNIDESKLYLTKPTFFSRIDQKPAVVVHDEYWHPHIDRVTYGTFYYTSLLYLNEYEDDFTGGRFIFVDKYTNKTIEPSAGRLSFFTSGSENVHRVEKVKSGIRYAMTVSFTCDKQHAIDDPVLH